MRECIASLSWAMYNIVRGGSCRDSIAVAKAEAQLNITNEFLEYTSKTRIYLKQITSIFELKAVPAKDTATSP